MAITRGIEKQTVPYSNNDIPLNNKKKAMNIDIYNKDES